MCLTIILHADDYGLNAAVTAGILHGFRHGLLTSTALLANAPHAAAAIAAWKDFAPRGAEQLSPSLALRRKLDDGGRPFDLGVHLNLTQGRPLTGDRYSAELLDGEGRFPGIFRLFGRLHRRAETHFAAALRDELAAQIAWLVDHGVRPTHLNGHQYVELLPPVARLLPDLLARFAIPVVRRAVEPALARTTLWHGFRLRAWLLAAVKQRYAQSRGRRPPGTGRRSTPSILWHGACGPARRAAHRAVSGMCRTGSRRRDRHASRRIVQEGCHD